jgi:hypothetical protein
MDVIEQTSTSTSCCCAGKTCCPARERESSKMGLHARRIVLRNDSLRLVEIVLGDMAGTSLMIKRPRPQSVQLATQLLDHGFQLGVLFSKAASFLLYRLDLLALSRAAFGSCDLVLLAMPLSPLVGADAVFVPVLMAVFSRLQGFAMSLVRSVACSACFLALVWR